MISGAAASDTILAPTAAPFTVEVVDQSGKPIDGTSVRFDTKFDASDPTGARRSLYACDVRLTVCAAVIGNGGYAYTGTSVVTDHAGRASATVQFGFVAGAGQLQVSVPAQGDSIAIAYTTRPGAVDHLVVDERDTAIYVGATYSLHAHTADRAGNARADGVNLHVVTTSVIALSSGRLTALGTGRGKILLQSGAVSDTAFVSVPPRGRIVTNEWAPDFSRLTQLTLVNTDGSDRRVVLRTFGNDGGASPDWTSTGDGILFEGGIPPDGGSFLNLTDTLGANRRLIPDGTGFIESVEVAAAAQTGDLFFYSAGNTFGTPGIFRARADGTEATFLFSGLQPAPSPDGLRVAFIVPGSDGVLMVRDVGTGHEVTIATQATRPRWSPSGDRIAYVGPGQGSVHVVKPDGSALLSVETGFIDSHVSWSPDAAWLVVSGQPGGLRLIRASDGVVLPIVGTPTLQQAAWRP